MKTDSAQACWMIVDDNKDILMLMQAVIERFSNAKIEYFNSPLVALAAFTAAPEKFQFVITDLEMPGMNGIELSRRLLELSPSLKILLMTGSNIVSSDAAANMGFGGLLQKPFQLSELQDALEAAGVSGQGEQNGEKKDFEKISAKPAVLTMT